MQQQSTITGFGLDIDSARVKLKDVVKHTPLIYNASLSKKYNCAGYLKREDLQIVRSYKLRGAYNMISSLPEDQRAKGVVCASAGNHAQGFAYSCKVLNIKGIVFMPIITPNQKVRQTKMFGDGNIEIKLVGDTFDDCAAAAKAYTEANGMSFIPPFDHPKVIEGQATVGLEILEDLQDIDYLFAPVGGGGLIAGVGAYFQQVSPDTKIIGIEPEGAPSMSEALKQGAPVKLDSIDPFVDGAAVKRVGDYPFDICKEVIDEMFKSAEKLGMNLHKFNQSQARIPKVARRICFAARQKIETELGKRVFLDLWVKVKEDWRQRDDWVEVLF